MHLRYRSTVILAAATTQEVYPVRQLACTQISSELGERGSLSSPYAEQEQEQEKLNDKAIPPLPWMHLRSTPFGEQDKAETKAACYQSAKRMKGGNE